MFWNLSDGEPAQVQPDKLDIRRAVFAGGCFWCMQPAFDMQEGVISTTVGYVGDKAQNAHYADVSTGKTAHREAIEVVYDPNVLNYADVLEIYWQSIDPFDDGGQFFDRGEQYRTAIYPQDADQLAIAEASKAQLQERFAPKIVATEILEPMEFFPAEEYHQDYYLKSPLQYKAYKGASGRHEKLEGIWNEAIPQNAQD